jgi:hypothetical protein
MNKAAELLKKRDEKAIPHLEQYAPVWLVDEQVFENEEAVQFHIIFRHHLYGWVNRRYRYDGFNNVLYHKGQTALSEVEAAEIEATEPYINPVVADIPNAYGG